MIKGIVYFILLLLIIPPAGAKVFAREPNPENPNIIFVLVDDLRWDAMGFMGKYPFLKTPNIDRLRNEGVHFENAFVTHSLCAPSRATILTGTFSHIHGVNTNQEGREFNSGKTPSFAQVLQGNGYTTAFIGKWHMAPNNRPRKGFDYWCSFTGQGNYYGNLLNINGKGVRNERYITDELNKYALEFIDNNANKPFCLYLSHKAVHQPFTPPERYQHWYEDDPIPEPLSWRDEMKDKPAWQRFRPGMKRVRDKYLDKMPRPESRTFGPWSAKTGRGKQKDYLRCLLAVDEGIGKMYKLLREKGILNNTVIVFAGDNGFFHGEHGLGDKRLAYNESMRIPLVIRYPEIAKAGQSVPEIVLNADIAPTFLDMAGVKIPGQMQGKSLVPLLLGRNEGWRKSFLFTYWPDLVHSIPRIVAVRTDRYLYSTTPDIDDIDELYDEFSDPYELNNLAEDPEYGEIKRTLSQELEKLKRETDYLDEVPRPHPEPVLKVRSGKLFSHHFGQSSAGPHEKEIRMAGVKNTETNGKVCGGFLDAAYAVVQNKPDLDPSRGTFVIECMAKPESHDGVIASAGSQREGWALYLEDGMPGFVVAHNGFLQFVDGTESITGKWSHLVAVIENYHNNIRLYVNGRLAGQRRMLLPIRTINDNGISIGRDSGQLVDPEAVSTYKYRGLIQEIAFYREKMPNSEVKKLYHLSKNK